MNTSQLAINSVTTKHGSLEEALDAYSAAGFRNVEFVLPHLKEWMKAGRTVDDARTLLARHALRPIGGFEGGVESFSEPASREANHRRIIENAKLIHDLGGGVLVVGTDGPPQASMEALDVVASTFRDLARRIEGYDVAIAIEFNWSPLIKSLKSAVAVAEKADHPQIGVLFDPAHYYVTPSKLEHLTADAVRWIKHVHVDDMRDKPGELSNCNSDRVLPGEGILDLTAIFGRLEEHGYRDFYSIEMFNEDLWRLPAAETARLCYRSLLPYCRDGG